VKQTNKSTNQQINKSTNQQINKSTNQQMNQPKFLFVFSRNTQTYFVGLAFFSFLVNA